MERDLPGFRNLEGLGVATYESLPLRSTAHGQGKYELIDLVVRIDSSKKDYVAGQQPKGLLNILLPYPPKPFFCTSGKEKAKGNKQMGNEQKAKMRRAKNKKQKCNKQKEQWHPPLDVPSPFMGE